MIGENDIVIKNGDRDNYYYKVISINNGIAKLKCLDYRFYSEESIDNLSISSLYCEECNNDKIISNGSNDCFTIPGKILHIDSDIDYLNKSMNYYKSVGLEVIGICIKESDIFKFISILLTLFHPNVLVITGHDSLKINNNNFNYENSLYFSFAIKEARKFENDKNKLIIVAGACQSDFDLLIDSGANFASSPSRVNIHALDPAIIASYICFSSSNEILNIEDIINKTKFGLKGVGGIVSNGVMCVGIPKIS